MPLYRLYIDESGTHSYSNSNAIDKRYPAITGVIISRDDVVNVLEPALRSMKLLVTGDPDEHITLHREEIANRKGHYSALTQPEIEAEWNRCMLELFRRVDFRVCTVVIDKYYHKMQYTAPMHPYHYCLHLMLERYVTFLERNGGTGDVMAEARGKLEDQLLMQEYEHVYMSGTGFVRSSRFQSALTSNKLKLKPKDAIAGLELADLVVALSKLDVLLHHSAINRINSKFMTTLLPLLQPKYFRNPSTGRVEGYGKKFIGPRK